MFAKYPGKQVAGKNVTIPEFKLNSLRCVGLHVADDTLPDDLLEIASDTKNDNHRKVDMALKSMVRYIHIQYFVQGRAKRLFAVVPPVPCKVAGLDCDEVERTHTAGQRSDGCDVHPVLPSPARGSRQDGQSDFAEQVGQDDVELVAFLQ